VEEQANVFQRFHRVRGVRAHRRRGGHRPGAGQRVDSAAPRPGARAQHAGARPHVHGVAQPAAARGLSGGTAAAASGPQRRGRCTTPTAAWWAPSAPSWT
jgi:hypothetical protein